MKRLNVLLVFFVCILLKADIALAQKSPHRIHLKTWQEQLEYVKNKGGSGTGENRIRCVGYTYKGRIETEDEKHKTIEQQFSDSAYMARNIGAFEYEIVSVKTVMQGWNAKALGVTDVHVKLKSELEALVQIGMELIEIEWSYKGNTFYSTAIAANECGGILYDNIGYLIAERPESSELRTKDAGGWKNQLEEIQQNEMLKEKAYPQLVGYTYLGEIETADGVEKIKKKLLSYTDNYFPVVNEGNGNVELLNFKEIQKRKGEKDVSVSVNLISETLNRIIRPGMHTVELTWECHSNRYKSLCVVSDNAIVYEHIVMNLMLTKEKEIK